MIGNFDKASCQIAKEQRLDGAVIGSSSHKQCLAYYVHTPKKGAELHTYD